MQILKLYEILRWDGGERQVSKGEFFTNKDEAILACSRVNGNIVDRVLDRTFKVYDSYDDFRQNTNKAIRERALAKLTPEEINELGLDK